MAADFNNTTLGVFKYIGQNGKLDYKTGKLYRLKITGWQFPIIELPRKCPYDSWEDFFKDWQQVL